MRPHALKLDELTWPEIRDLLADGWTRVIVPLGSTEQHGPGLHWGWTPGTVRRPPSGRRGGG